MEAQVGSSFSAVPRSQAENRNYLDAPGGYVLRVSEISERARVTQACAEAARSFTFALR